ncbi:translation initiation factor IF-3 [bacterium]|nr:translation initiation factor IF-3 [bacterium]
MGGTFIKHYIINEKIKAEKVRLIDNEGNQLGILPISEARRLSLEKNLDLLLLSGNASPPVCKIVDYGQFMYHQKKKEKQSRRSGQVIKELKLSHKISSHDYNVRINQAIKFLSKKYKVKVTVVFRGREIVFRDKLGVEMVNRFLNDIEEYGIKDNDIVKSGRNLMVMVNPK